MADGGGADRVAVRVTLRDRVDAHVTAGAGSVVDNPGPAEPILETLAYDAGQDVGRATGRIGNDDADRSAWPVLALGECRAARRCSQRCGSAAEHRPTRD